MRALLERGAAYAVQTPDVAAGDDLYLDLTTDAGLRRGLELDAASRCSRSTPTAAATRSAPASATPLDPLLWRAARDGEPSWSADGLPDGRPGWHIECTAIALDHLGMSFDVQGGGTDLVFPHHEMSATQAVVLTKERPFARTYAHQAMVGLDGEKMSKSKGNLVLVSRLRADGVDPMAIRLALLSQHYRTEWSWTDDLLAQAQAAARDLAVARCRSTPARRQTVSSRPSATASPTTSTPRAPWPPWTLGRQECLTRGGSGRHRPGGPRPVAGPAPRRPGLGAARAAQPTAEPLPSASATGVLGSQGCASRLCVGSKPMGMVSIRSAIRASLACAGQQLGP